MLCDDTTLADGTLISSINDRLRPNKVMLPVGFHWTVDQHVDVRVERLRCRFIVVDRGKLKWFR